MFSWHKDFWVLCFCWRPRFIMHRYAYIFFVAIKKKFQEKKYHWIEKWIHVCAACLPLIARMHVAVTGAIQPTTSRCYPSTKSDASFGHILGFGQLVIYFIIHPSAMLSVWCLIKKPKYNWIRPKKWSILSSLSKSTCCMTYCWFLYT